MVDPSHALGRRTLDPSTHQQAADAIGVARQTVSKWVSACRRGGPTALQSQKRGRDSASQKVLTSSAYPSPVAENLDL
jgi:transposase-like protein